MKKLLLTSVLAMTMAMPAMADVDIAAGANTADCDSDVLKTTSGSANLEANWDPNTITLNWYAGSDSNTPLTVQTGAQTCIYDGAITLPATNPTKPGYTFDHWIVRQLFDLSTLNPSTGGSAFGYSAKNEKSGDGSNEAKYGLTPGGREWAVEFSYGTVKGIAPCSATNGTYANPSETDGQYCWCKATGFDAEKDGTFVGVASPSWVFNGDLGSASNCAAACASRCAYYVRDRSAFRAALYGVTQ